MKGKFHSLDGAGKVFSFTVSQYFKSKANMISFILLIVMSLASVPMYLMFSGSGAAKTDGGYEDIEKVYVLNDTKYEDLAESISEEHKEVSFVKAEFDDLEYKENIGENDAYIHIEYIEDANLFQTTAGVSDNSKIDDGELELITSLVTDSLDKARYKDSGMSEEDISKLLNCEVGAGLVSDYNADSRDFGASFAIQYGYSMIVLMLCVISASYIIRAVIEEKASKLIDLLMVSVKPFALIVGKILGVMTCVFSMIISIFAGFFVSYFATGIFMDTSPIRDMLESPAVKEILGGIGPDTIVVALISLILGYLIFSILAGITGASVSSMDDVESSNLSVMLIVLAGYIVSCVTCAFESSAVAVATSLIPIVSVFCAPVRFVFGDISVWILILSWAIQALAVLALAKFCSKVYSALILHKGNKLKLKQVISFAKTSQG